MSRHLTPDEKRTRSEQIVIRFTKGDTTEQIANARDMSIGEVNRTLRRAGIDPGHSPLDFGDLKSAILKHAHRAPLLSLDFNFHRSES